MITMNKIRLALAAAVFTFAIATSAMAQAPLKIGYTSVQYVLAQMPESKQIESDLKAYSDLDKLYRNYQAEEVVLTEPMKKKRQDEILKKEQDIKAYQNKIFGFEGQLFKKRQELTKPVQDQVFEAIEKVAKKKQLAIVFDKAGDLTMLYTNPTHDYTEFVLEELGLGSEERNQAGQKGTVRTVETPQTPATADAEADPDQPAASRPRQPVRSSGQRPATRKK